MLPNKHEVAGSIGLARANPYWEISRAVSSLIMGALVISLMDGITGTGERRDATLSPGHVPSPTHYSSTVVIVDKFCIR